MRVATKKIGKEALEIAEYIDAARWYMDSEDIRFLGDIYVKCSFLKKEEGIEVRVDLNFKRNIRCSRCLEWNIVESQSNFSLNYKNGEIREGFLEVDSEIREHILLEWPLKPLCREDCRGICPGCGRNLNVEKCICGTSRPRD